MNAGVPVHSDEITWHRPPFSFRHRDRALSYAELCQVTDVEAMLETLTLSEQAGWVLDLIQDRESLRVALTACMDALHVAPKRRAA